MHRLYISAPSALHSSYSSSSYILLWNLWVYAYQNCVCVDCYLQGGLGEMKQIRCSNLITGYNKSQDFFQGTIWEWAGRRRRKSFLFFFFYKGTETAFSPPNRVGSDSQFSCVWTFEYALQNLTWWKLTPEFPGDSWKTHFKGNTLISSHTQNWTFFFFFFSQRKSPASEWRENCSDYSCL